MPQAELDLDGRLRSHGLPNPTFSQIATERALNSVESAAKGSRKRTAVFAATFSILGVCVMVPTASYAYQTFQAQTGIFNASADATIAAEDNQPNSGVDAHETLELGSESTPNDEWINVSAGDVGGYISSVAPRSLPLPSSVTWEDVIGSVTKSTQDNANALGTEVHAEANVLQIAYEHAVRLAWISEWFEAYDSNDEARISKASAVLENSVDWPATLKSFGGKAHEPTREWMKILSNGDFEAAQAYAQLEKSSLWDGTDREPLIAVILDGAYSGTETVLP